MHTLQDFLLVTKAETYLIAIGFLVVFPLFWRWLSGPAPVRKSANRDRLRSASQPSQPSA